MSVIEHKVTESPCFTVFAPVDLIIVNNGTGNAIVCYNDTDTVLNVMITPCNAIAGRIRTVFNCYRKFEVTLNVRNGNVL